MTKLMFSLVTGAKNAQAREWLNYMNAVASGKRAASTATVDSPALTVGQILNATDRCYIVQPNGAWKRLKTVAEVPAYKSQIRLLPKADRNKYTREESQRLRLQNCG